MNHGLAYSIIVCTLGLGSSHGTLQLHQGILAALDPEKVLGPDLGTTVT